MDEAIAPKFGTIDYCSFAAVLLISVAIGVYASLKGNKSPDDFLMGGRSFGPIPVSMSLLTSFVSAISLLGYTGEAYAYGIQMYLFIVGIAVGIGVSAVVSMPVIFPLKLTSINEYIILRFKSKKLRDAILGITCVQGLLYMGVCLYAPTIALSTVTPLSSLTYVFLLGAVVTVYSSIGGIRAVVWTDVFQLVIMVIGIVVVFVVGLMDAGGIEKVWKTAYEGGRLSRFDTDPSIYMRHNIYNTFFFGVFLFAANYGISQINVQRLCSVRTINDAKLILLLNSVGMILLFVLIFGQGVIAYVVYADCDPLMRGLIQKKEEIMPFFIVDRMGFVTGLPGLFVATLIGGALSSLSSTMNAIVAMIWKDLCNNIKVFSKMKPKTAGIVNKVITLIIGLLTIGTALVAQRANNLIQFTLSIGGVLLGGIFGVFLLGFLFPKTNLKGVWAGLIISSIFVSWICIGAYFYGESVPPLPLSVQNCSSLAYAEDGLETIVALGPAFFPSDSLQSQNYFPLMSLYGISYTLYPIIGTSSCVIIGVVVSFLTGNQSLKTVSPWHVTPFMRGFYWTKEELASWERVTLETERHKSSDSKLEDEQEKKDIVPISFKVIYE